ncbi:MAG: translation initiation factor [Ginsengibacter sp.]
MKKKNSLGGLVYSTDPNFKIQEPEEIITLLKKEQKLKVLLDKKQRAGKIVTLVEGFIGTVADAETLARQLKNLCGTGGSVKDFIIIIQGENKEKIFTWLVKEGYTLSKKV